MKKIFTLVALAAMAIGANAQGEWRPDGETLAAESTLASDDLIEVKSVFESAGGTGSGIEINGKEFGNYINIRVNANPSADVPTGTEQSGSTPLVVTAKQDVNLTIYYRRQSANGTYTANDGKDIKMVKQSAPGTAISSTDYNCEDIDGEGSYGNVYRTYALEAGTTYTIWARGTTGRFYGFDWAAGEGGGNQGGLSDGKVILSFDGFEQANKITYENGISIQITGNESKNIQGGSAITIDGKTYTSMKVSNGAQNTLLLPEGKVAKGITFYSYVNKDAATERDSYWKEVASMTYDTPDASGGIFQSYKDAANPDKRTYDFGTNQLSRITFTNTGEQCCYVIEIDIISGEDISTGIQNAAVIDVQDAPAYNVAGQKVGAAFKGIVIKNGKKVIVK